MNATTAALVQNMNHQSPAIRPAAGPFGSSADGAVPLHAVSSNTRTAIVHRLSLLLFSDASHPTAKAPAEAGGSGLERYPDGDNFTDGAGSPPP